MGAARDPAHIVASGILSISIEQCEANYDLHGCINSHTPITSAPSIAGSIQTVKESACCLMSQYRQQLSSKTSRRWSRLQTLEDRCSQT
ncbi:hypothetical protein BDR03DRAFT_964170 [Suillus americanus]|nr:hypothetical protein BDR03DRAFT_964170 [Suillus americanus]